MHKALQNPVPATPTRRRLFLRMAALAMVSVAAVQLASCRRADEKSVVSEAARASSAKTALKTKPRHVAKTSDLLREPDVASKNAPPARASAEPPSRLVDFIISAADLDTYRHLHTAKYDNPWKVYFWWDDVPASIRSQRLKPPVSNIRKADYVGPESCQKCHEENYESWLSHPHRLMNAVADEKGVQGDFSGRSSIDYKGGRGTFYRQDDEYRMRLIRGDLRRTFSIRRTIGSRFFQYYVGLQIEGPEPRDHPVWNVDHVLPFGYWMSQGWWVPIVHVSDELPDEQREDPFAEPSKLPYDRSCAVCHNTFASGDRMLWLNGIDRLFRYTPRSVSIFAAAHLAESHPELVDPKTPFTDTPTKRIDEFFNSGKNGLTNRENALTLGISCEACHYGCKEHAANPTQLPPFFPSGKNIFVTGNSPEKVWGRTSENVNWTCARCHSGNRPQFAGGMHTWNSTEYTDAAHGHCYTADPKRRGSLNQLTCVHCHDPHEAIGQKWSATPRQDDGKCITCHEQFKTPKTRIAHTHHDEGSEGARCLNCHMPRLNEGINGIVRTHRIFSPTNRAMIEANQPNACNLCHLDKPIDWTIKHLNSWYPSEDLPDDISRYSGLALSASYPKRDGPVGRGWLNSKHESTRLVAASALTKANARWALPELIDMLDDPFLINRQFTQSGLEEMLNLRLHEFGYRFYMMRDERRVPLGRVRAAILKQATKSKASAQSPQPSK